MKKITLLLALLVASISYGQIVINEVDSDQTSTDTTEFIELLSDTPNFSLNGYIVVLFNGSNDTSYETVDLTGFTTDANGYFIIGSDATPGVDIMLGPDNTIQNGTDAIAIYQDSAATFPDGTAPTTTNLIDAVVYTTGDGDDEGLRMALGLSTFYDEDANGMKDTESIQRASDGTYCTGAPTLRLMNIDCGTVCPLQVSVESVVCDAVTSGTDTYTTTLSFTGGGTETYTIAATDGTVGGDDPTTDASGTITITGVDEGADFTYTITSTTCSISNMINAPDCIPASDVATIAELRAGTLGVDYTLTGEVLLTFQKMERNQKWIEDATAAILIDDPAGVITTTYSEGDGITGISGTLTEFGDLLQFRPTMDPGAPSSTGNTLTPQAITQAMYDANPTDYESELIALTNVLYTDGDGTTVFEIDTDYALDGTVTVHRTSIEEADYIGQLVPFNPIPTFVALGSSFNGAPQLLVRRGSDIGLVLGTAENALEQLSIYPNPSTTGYINIESPLNGDMNVIIYDVLGKQVINTVVAGERLNISSLKSGVYMVQVSQDGSAVTKKLVVR
ncbi:T9SS type A sorting domain-containing protein [Jejudonia soesokkakensis]|uniref:T9SS type A sorting domain-containing protein n=1 Tax=Jejudonia soesokkakensis TaxID=1323432 RepID=A0ABW2MRE8_9FLAO